MGRVSRFDPRHSRKVLVAVVDGNAEHRTQLAGALTSFYEVAEFTHGNQAMDELCQAPPCLLVVDEKAPAADNLLRQMRGDAQLSGTPVICTTRRGSTDRHRDGVDVYLEKPYRRSLLLGTISRLVNKSVEAEWEKLPELQRCALRKTVEVFNSISDLIERGEPLQFEVLSDACRPLVQAVAHNEYRSILGSVRDHDNYSYVHSLRVGTLLSLFGYTIGLRGDDLLQLACGGLVHDIGKMAIPHGVLNKPGKLSPQEWTVMQSHVKGSIRFLRNSALPRSVVTIAAQHHEKLNGAGYPFGLKGRQLNELARMASIVDVFSALTDRRVYKEPMAPQHALAIMSGDMREELDQGLLSLFRSMLLEASGHASA